MAIGICSCGATPQAKVTQVANININFNILFFSEKKLEYNTVQLRVYKGEYI